VAVFDVVNVCVRMCVCVCACVGGGVDVHGGAHCCESGDGSENCLAVLEGSD
jgi:hypothetical protein